MEILASGSVAVAARSDADGSLVPARHRRTLTKIDRRFRFGRRVTELAKLFTAAVAGEITPLRRHKIEEAAQLTAIAEQARGDFMRDGKGALDDIAAIERKAYLAVRAIGIIEAKRREPSLGDYLAQRTSAKDAAE